MPGGQSVMSAQGVDANAAAATQYLPPVPGGGARAEDATQMLPPQGGGAAASYAPPVEFDGLFRAAEPTQQLPPVPPGVGPVRSAPGEPAPRPRQRKMVLIGAGVAACAAAGLGVGALLSGGGGGGKAAADTPQSVASTEPGSSPSATAGKPADPAQAQAQALDALLKDSGNSRDSVIKAVDATRSCKDLGKSAGDLRTAAGQRNDLVSRLQKTAIDKLPNNDQLAAQLTKAWQSSAAADNSYASWADHAGGKHGCVKGHARPTKDAAAGDRASGEATAAKKKAADLWNPIAKKYGLPQRQWTQL
ncbi:hypothetical protein [Streptomyces orinoci]|uniref:Uncharacterized protein n=1 Tax=Streptomyces orinoci TaxID=67339 RepID=A0ABV3JVN8_STRON|nr:hypothetical protein [Streptomyces orinoci]